VQSQRKPKTPRAEICGGEPEAGDGCVDKSEAGFDALTARSVLAVLVDFWAPWCGPCQVVAPELAKVAAQGATRWLVAKVNTQELPELAQRFQISGIPTLALFKAGREIARQSGAMPAKTILQFIHDNTDATRRP